MKIIGLIIRGKHSETHNPDLLEQHADVVLSDGAPIGYFGEGGGAFARSGMFMDGVIYDYNSLKQQRPYYVDLDLARQLNVISTICTIKVEDDVAKKFDDYWRNLKNNNKGNTFSLLGNNCSTHAADAFRAAGVLKSGISGLDTPDHLYHDLKFRYGANFRCSSGYVGFTQAGRQFQFQVERP